MRFGIWAAVSTKEQAKEDKVSLREQLQLCRSTAISRGWIETAGPWIAPGESRTRWVNLRDAENAITDGKGGHPLRDMLDACKNGRVDLVLLYDFTRLRDLLDPVAKTLQSYNVQLFSYSQQVEPLDPELYTSNETASILQFVSGFGSRAEIAGLKRRYRLGMPKRISEKGLPKGRPPFGYRKPPGREWDSSAVPIIDAPAARTVIQIKDLFLSGKSQWQIADALTAAKIPSPSGSLKWSSTMVNAIIKRRFYSGQVYFGIRRRAVDPRTGAIRSVRNPVSRLIVAEGRHEPLWDKTTQRKIDDELSRRRISFAGRRTHRLSNLLYCSCGSRMWEYASGLNGQKVRKLAWTCRRNKETPQESHKHSFAQDAELLPIVGAKLQSVLRKVKDVPPPSIQSNSLPDPTSDLRARRSRLTEAYAAGVLPLQDYAQLSGDIDKQIGDAAREATDHVSQKERIDNFFSALKGWEKVIDHVPRYLMEAPEQEVNSELRKILDRIVVGKEITLVLRAPIG